MSDVLYDSFLDDNDQQQQQQAPVAGQKGRFAYITLLTRASYLAGVVLLAHTLRQQGSEHPLIVLYTPTLTTAALRALEVEAEQSRLIIKPCELLVPAEHHQLNVAVERFSDTWTKLRVFQSFDYGYDTICYLDADMTILKNMDSVFDNAANLPNHWIAAVHDCVCSPDKMEWTPKEHCKENCAFNAPGYPQGLVGTNQENLKPTYQLFNSGMFLFHPTEALWNDMIDFFDTTDLLGTFRFPDQDFLTTFFRGRWAGLLWKYNAVKTMAYRHTNLWRKDEIVCLHYIVDKPWAKRIGADGIAGFKGMDGETHRWWWDEYEAWFNARQDNGKFEVAAIVSRHVARRDSDMSDGERPDMTAIGVKVHGAGGKGKDRTHSEEVLPESVRASAALGGGFSGW